jgi:hypothetical protein
VGRAFPLALTALFTAGGLALPVGAAFAAVSGRTPQIQTVALIGSVAALVSCVICAGVLLYQPNRNLEQNRRRVRAALDNGAVVIVRPGSESPDNSTPGRLPHPVLIAVLGVVAALCMLAAPIYRVSNGWDRNTHITPEVCEPGDEFRMTFPDTIMSLDSRWSGEARAELVAPEVNGRRIPLTASTQQETWGKHQIWTAGNQKSQPLWAKVRVPEDQSLGGKQVKISVVMVVTYPVEVVPNATEGRQQRVFDDRQQRVERTIDVNLTPVGVRNDYSQMNLIGTLTGAGLVFAILGLLTLAAAFDRTPKSVVALKQLAATRDDSREPESEELPPWKRGCA